MDSDDQPFGYRYSLRFGAGADSCMTFWLIDEIARNSAISVEADLSVLFASKYMAIAEGFQFRVFAFPIPVIFF